MTEQNITRSLHRKIAEIVQLVENVEKDGYNAHFGYAFTSEGALLRALREAMAQRHLTLYPSVIPESIKVEPVVKVDPAINVEPVIKGYITTCAVNYTFTDGESGESFTACIPCQGYDSQDKGAYKAMTGAIKYALRQTFMIPTGDDAENDHGSQGGGSNDRAEDNLQMGILAADTPFTATVREAAWAKPKGKDKIVMVAGVKNTGGGLDAGEKLWLEPGKRDYDQAVAVIGEGESPSVGSDLSSWLGRSFDLTVTLNGDYRNFAISAATPVVEAVPNVA